MSLINKIRIDSDEYDIGADYENLTNTPYIPEKTSDLTNDGDGNSNFATESYVDTYGGKIDKIKVNEIYRVWSVGTNERIIIIHN